ncbi:MAG TPA: hypothetical protein VFS83_06665, partial [Ktedonobacterales bacterium]|nr:hypothetical protein [Ktedonobacterales bacterium]
GTDRVRPLDRNSVDAVGHFVQSVNYSALDAIDVSSNEVRRFLEGLFLRYLQVNPAFKSPRHARYLPALRARAPRLAADVHRGLLASLDGKAPTFGAPPRKQSWIEGRERARKLSQEEYERTTRILEAAIIRSRIDDYSNSGFVPQAEPADVARRPPAPASPVANPSPGNDQWLNSTTANDLTVPVSATGFAAAFGALGINATGTQPAPPLPPVSGSRRPTDQPTSPMPAASISPRNGAIAPRELPEDLYELYGDYLQDMQPDTTITPAVSSRPATSYPATSYPAAQSHPQSHPAVPRSGATPAAAPWQSAPNPPPGAPPVSAPTPRPPQPQLHNNGQPANPSTHADQMVFWQLRYQLEAYVRRAAESYGLSYNGSDPSAVLDALRQSGFVDEADLRIAEGILALTDRVTRSSNVAMEDYRQAFLLYLLYHRSHLGI